MPALPDAVTLPRIFSIVLAETPALDRSSTESYGRPAMIFFAVTAPTPGSASSSLCDAAFRSTLPLAFVDELSDFSGALSDFVLLLALLRDDFSLSADCVFADSVEPPREAFTSGRIFVSVASDTTPAFPNADTEE